MARALCDAESNDAENWAVLGRIQARAGRHGDAAASFTRALALNPKDLELRFSLAESLIAAGNVVAAAAQLEEFVKFRSADARAWFFLGAAYGQLGRIADALRCSERAVALAPDHVDAHYNLAQAYMHQIRLRDAVRHYRAVVRLRPDHYDALVGAGVALHDLGEHDEARRFLAEAMRLRPGAESVRFMLASIGGAEAPATAPRQYVSDLFDKYADRFDSHLVDGLQYRTPEFLVALAREHLADAGAPYDVIDIGCGTGLCGPLFRPFARRMTGIDLSRRMLDKARERGVYDELIEGDVSEALARLPPADLIVAADVFPYVGDLADILAACRHAMKPGGVLVFSTEAVEGDHPYVLRPSNRYAHTARYLHDMAARSRLDEAGFRTAVLRRDRNQPVHGFLCAFRRQDT